MDEGQDFEERGAGDQGVDGITAAPASMPPAWRAVYERIRQGHALAVLEAMGRPAGHEANAVLAASREALTAFLRAYEVAAVQAIARQIMGRND